MKTRSGFVSNSSTSSFVLIGFCLTVRKPTDKLKVLELIHGDDKKAMAKFAEVRAMKEGPNKRRLCDHEATDNSPKCGKATWEDCDPEEELESEINDLWCDYGEQGGEYQCRTIENTDDVLVGVEPIAISSDDACTEENIDLINISKSLEKLRVKLDLPEKMKVKIFGGVYEC